MRATTPAVLSQAPSAPGLRRRDCSQSLPVFQGSAGSPASGVDTASAVAMQATTSGFGLKSTRDMGPPRTDASLHSVSTYLVCSSMSGMPMPMWKQCVSGWKDTMKWCLKRQSKESPARTLPSASQAGEMAGSPPRVSIHPLKVMTDAKRRSSRSQSESSQESLL